ncbi:hypothetical protein [Stackebrandtia nassauensis]|uniref:hypothetical protein n=1 Tax=Stackebrandtia nassauensis TaxID=283811 RepID=UPI0001A3A065|nr:hypothetical protein [Stackebrandtia nassauensis]
MSKRGTEQVKWTVTLRSAGGQEWTYEIETDPKTSQTEVARAAWLWHDREGGGEVDPRLTEANRA